MKASQMSPYKNISILLKGPFGMGKTIAASSFCIFGDVYIAYFDKPVPTELHTFYHKIGRPELLDRIEYDCYTSNNVNDYINKLVRLTKEPNRYAAVITDSVTNLTSASVNWSIGFRGSDNKKKKQDDRDKFIPDWDEYKVETSLVSQALDLCRSVGGYNIWIAHPLPQIKIEGSGSSISVTKTSQLVSYGAKVGAMIPGGFTEIYHFGRQVNKRVVWTDMVGDDFAKTALNLPQQLDTTDKLFAEVWKAEVDKQMDLLKPKPTLKETQNQEVPSEVTNQSFASPFSEPPKTKWRI